MPRTPMAGTRSGHVAQLLSNQDGGRARLPDEHPGGSGPDPQAAEPSQPRGPEPGAHLRPGVVAQICAGGCVQDHQGRRRPLPYAPEHAIITEGDLTLRGSATVQGALNANGVGADVHTNATLHIVGKNDITGKRDIH